VTSIRERLTPVPGGLIRSLETGPDQADRVVVVPGLDFVGYLMPLARELAQRGIACSVLDVPGFGSRLPLVSDATVPGIAEAVGDWLLTQPPGRVLLAGHSTGAQNALRAALMVQDSRDLEALLLAGPTFVPAQRRLRRLALATTTAYRRDTPGQLVVLRDLVRGRADVGRLILDGMKDTPEDSLCHLRAPVLLTSGRHDSFAPQPWLATLRSAAVGSPWPARVVQLPGSHNNPYTHANLLAMLIETVWNGSLRVSSGVGRQRDDLPALDRAQDAR